MRVAICGPNLRDQSKGEFHVHRDTCQDLITGRHKEPEYKNAWVISAENAVDICDLIYPPDDFECESGEYLSFLHFFPCCKELLG